jgi:Ser/Thr protein kinase RdoA (MazF antagonist)
MSAEHKAPTDRLNYTGDLAPVVSDVCQAYDLGEVKEFSVIEVGYEDCNVIIDSDRGKVLAKMFAKFRTQEDVQRYVTTIEKVLEAGVQHPALMRTQQGDAVYRNHDIEMSLLEFVEGKTFYDLNRIPNDEERQSVIEQAAKINSIDYKPPYLFDSWAIPHIRSMYNRVKRYIEADDLRLVERAMEQYEAAPIKDLPHAFVHGDIIKTNTLKGDDGKIYILDFSVANWYPRVQELAVIIANLLHDENVPSLDDQCRLVADEYSQFTPLTALERKHLPTCALAAIAMEFMGSHQEKYVNGIDNEETEHWLASGRDGLRKAFRES